MPVAEQTFPKTACGLIEESRVRDTVIVDLDGTIANLDHRLHHIKGEHKDFRAFHDAAVDDTLNVWCRQLMYAMKERQFRIEIVSGRPRSYFRQTAIWLYQNDVPYSRLNLVRQDGDYTPDQVLKRDWLEIYGSERILFAVDDRQRVVDMWRENGVVCLQCNVWAEK